MTFQDPDQLSSRIKVGKIVMPHGVKGLVKILPLIDTITDYPVVFIDQNSDKTLKITYKNRLNKYILAEIDGISDRNGAESLKKPILFIEKDYAPVPERGFFDVEIIGMPVLNENGDPIGTVKGIENYGASDLLDIRLMIGKDVMVPLTEDFVTEAEGGLIVVNYEAFL